MDPQAPTTLALTFAAGYAARALTGRPRRPRPRPRHHAATPSAVRLIARAPIDVPLDVDTPAAITA